MREIEFRGYDKTSEEWVYGHLFENKLGLSLIFSRKYGEGIAVDPKSVGQYIGRKDSSAKKIYEGDIVHPHKEVGLASCAKVIYSDELSCFCLSHECYPIELSKYGGEELCVVSNIYEKPDYKF